MSDRKNRDIGRKVAQKRCRPACGCWLCSPAERTAHHRKVGLAVRMREAIEQTYIALRRRGISRRATVDEAGDTVWPDSDFLYEPAWPNRRVPRINAERKAFYSRLAGSALTVEELRARFLKPKG